MKEDVARTETLVKAWRKAIQLISDEDQQIERQFVNELKEFGVDYKSMYTNMDSDKAEAAFHKLCARLFSDSGDVHAEEMRQQSFDEEVEFSRKEAQESNVLHCGDHTLHSDLG
eukprot:SAG11_NODE_615_length_8197_cov_4.551426_2_plen_114_part_00